MSLHVPFTSNNIRSFLSRILECLLDLVSRDMKEIVLVLLILDSAGNDKLWPSCDSLRSGFGVGGSVESGASPELESKTVSNSVEAVPMDPILPSARM